MKTIGQILRELRDKQGLLLREVAAAISIDPTLLSKIERDERMPTKEQVNALAKFYKQGNNELQLAWLSDKLAYEVADEEDGLKALQVAEEKVAYKAYKKTDRNAIITQIKNYLAKDGRVEKAWLFGSFARGDDDYKSDIDMLIEVPKNTTFSFFDLADIQYNLEELTAKKVDVGFYGFMRPGIWERVKNEIKLLYEK